MVDGSPLVGLAPAILMMVLEAVTVVGKVAVSVLVTWY
jgi:hypothetical protein